jgi:hypothetical protein
MTFAELRKKEGRISGLVALEKVLPARSRSWIKKFIIVAAPIFMMTLFNFGNQHFISINFIAGVFLLFTASWLIIFLLDCFYYSHYFQGSRFAIKEWGVDSGLDSVPFEIIEIVSHTHPADATAGFFESRAGKDILTRLGFTQAEITSFVSSSREKVYADSLTLPDRLTLALYAGAIFDADKSLGEFLNKKGITREFFIGASSWVSYIYQSRKDAFRWWGRDALGRIKGVGKEWAVKEVYLLKEFGHFLTPHDEDLTFKREIDELERALARTMYSNALILANDLSECMSTINGLASRISDGTALSQIVHKKLLVIDHEAIEKAAVTSQEYNQLITNLFDQANYAGHIIFVIKDFPSFVLAFKKRDLDIIKIMGPYLSSPDVQVIAFSLKDIYEKALVNESALMSRFQRILVERDGRSVIIRALENKLFEVERKTGLFFTYQSLVAIADLASQNKVQDEITEDEAVRILRKLSILLMNRKQKKVTAEDIQGSIV